MRLRATLGLCVAVCSLWACADDDGEGEGAGNACSSDADCGALVCAADFSPMPADLDPLRLSCAKPGNGAAVGGACSTGDDCAAGICLLSGACAAACDAHAGCGAAADCAAVYARVTDDSLATLQACVTRVRLPKDALVSSEVRKRALTRGDVSITLPPPTAATTLYVLQHLSDTTWPVPDEQSPCRPPLCATRLATRSGDARVLFDLDALPMEADGPDNPIATGEHVNPLSVLIPNGPRAAPDPAGYQLTATAKQPGDLRVTMLARDAQGRRLDLNLYYVGARDLVVTGDRGIAPLMAALEEVERIFAPANIYLGEVRQIAVHGELLQRGTVLPDAEVSAGFVPLVSQYQVLPELPELFKLSAGAANVALDVFFVSGIDASGGGDVGGIAGGTPLPFGMHGSAGSGIAIAADMFLSANDSLGLGRTLAHELGHALGLFHTTEVDGLVFDPLPDTPVCSISNDSNHDGSLNAKECAAKGGDNLMFPTSDASDSSLTADQIAVLQRALILQ